MFNRPTIKAAVIMNLEQAIEACAMHIELEDVGTKFTTQLERIKQSDPLNDYEFVELISEVRQSLETIKFPNN